MQLDCSKEVPCKNLAKSMKFILRKRREEKNVLFYPITQLSHDAGIHIPDFWAPVFKKIEEILTLRNK